MESEKSALKRSFFREYFFYKLRGTLGIGITSAVLGFIACTLSGIVALSWLKGIENDFNNINNDYGSLPFTAMVGGLVGLAILALVTPIVSFKYYRSRSSMDTLGCLPITYGQRFWGDYLSGLAAIVAPFSVMAAIGGIPLAMAQPVINRVKEISKRMSTLDNSDKSFLLFGIKMYFVMLIIIVAAYSITTLVTSCCGKAGSMGLYSVIALPIIPAIVSLYGTFTLNNSVGILPEREINTGLSCFPPVGTFIYLIYAMRNFGYYSDSKFTIIPSAATVIVSLLFIAVIIAAAYFIGRKRKTERVGNSFVVNAMYHILTLLMVLAVIGVYFSVNSILGLDLTKILIGAVIALVFYLILELIQYRKFKTIWKSLIRYACVAVVGFGFLFAAVKTHGFGIGTHLPDQNNIEEITIQSREFGNGGSGVGTVKYRAENAISAILTENQRLIDNYDLVNTGSGFKNDYEIEFTYNLKNGKTVSRYYRIKDDDFRADVVEEIRKQPSYEIERLGVLNRDDLTGLKMSFIPFDDNSNPQNEDSVQIKDEKIPELVERLRYDIINSESDRDDIGMFVATLPDDWKDDLSNEFDSYYWSRWFIPKSYTRTIEFINNSDNFYEKRQENPASPDEVKLYKVYYNFMYTDENESSPAVKGASVIFRSDSDSEYAKELMSYFVSGAHIGEGSYFSADTIDPGDNHYLGETFYISKENHEAALKAMMKLIAEQTEALQ